jgi:hypothetical protein
MSVVRCQLTILLQAFRVPTLVGVFRMKNAAG